MREPHKKGVAHHLGSESCASDRKDAGEVLTGVHEKGAWGLALQSRQSVPALTR